MLSLWTGRSRLPRLKQEVKGSWRIVKFSSSFTQRLLLPYPSTAGGWKHKEYRSMQPPEISLLAPTTDPILPDLQFSSCDCSGKQLRSKSYRIQDKHLYKSRKLRDAQRILYKISSELYPEKTILDMISRVIGVVWCVRSEDAEFC